MGGKGSAEVGRRKDGRTKGGQGGRADGWTDGRMDRWADGRMGRMEGTVLEVANLVSPYCHCSRLAVPSFRPVRLVRPVRLQSSGSCADPETPRGRPAPPRDRTGSRLQRCSSSKAVGGSPRGAVGAIGGHGVECVDHTHDAGLDRNPIAGHRVGKTAAVHALVVRAHDPEHDRVVPGQRRQDPLAENGVLGDVGELLGGERSGFVEHRFASADLADVVQLGAQPNILQQFPGVAEPECGLYGE